MTKTGLYVHIPFCERKCLYCSFYSIKANEEVIDVYCKALCDEIKLVSKSSDNEIIKTIYVGGGTPSVLSQRQIESIFSAIYSSFRVEAQEVTIEVNPNSSGVLPFYRRMGVDRVSIGIQSSNNVILRKLGRLHTATEAKDTLERAASLYSNVSADIILGVDEKQNPIDEFTFARPFVQHVSAYMLSLEEGTPLYKSVKTKSVSVATENSVIDQYSTFVKCAKENGFIRYETSNFARSGYESKHNSSYWDLTPYIGVGASAHSYRNGVRYYNTADVKAYCNGVHSGYGRTISERGYAPIEDRDEYVMLRLRTTEGIDLSKYKEKFGSEFMTDYADGIKKSEEYVENANGFFRILPDFLLVQNHVIGTILS